MCALRIECRVIEPHKLAKLVHEMIAIQALTAACCDSPVPVHVFQLSAPIDEALHHVTGSGIGLCGSGVSGGDGQGVPATHLLPVSDLITTIHLCLAFAARGIT